MSRLIAATAGAPIDAADCLARAETARIDPRDGAAFASLAPLLASLAANRDFLAHTAVDALKRPDLDTNGGWGAQALLLAPPGDHFVLRASFWPGLDDQILADSGPAACFYGVAHDHDFDFLTCGHAGPGYRSDEWEIDPETVLGVPGERVALRPLGRHRLAPGEVRHYRAHRDVHAQIAPERFSISLNLLWRGAAHPWLGQYRYDTDKGCIAAALSVQPAELLIGLAIRIADGIDVAAAIGRGHPVPRTRIAAWRALAVAAPDAVRPLLTQADVAANRVLAAHAAAIETELEQSGG